MESESDVIGIGRESGLCEKCIMAESCVSVSYEIVVSLDVNSGTCGTDLIGLIGTSTGILCCKASINV